MKMNFLLDTNVFDFILDNSIEVGKLMTIGDFYTTNVQYSELKNISNDARRDELLKIYSDLQQTKVNLESGIWIDDLYWDDEQIWVDDIGQTAQDFTESKHKKPWKDALIGEIAKNKELILVTNDINFRNKAKSLDIESISPEEFKIQYLTT